MVNHYKPCFQNNFKLPSSWLVEQSSRIVSPDGFNIEAWINEEKILMLVSTGFIPLSSEKIRNIAW